jgi:hypothetical protein
LQGVLQEITTALSKSSLDPNPFDCASTHAVSPPALGSGIIAMLEVVTALFGVMSAGIFIAHAVDGYRSR